MKKVVTRMLLTVSGLLLIFTGYSQDGQALFQTYCAACHTIGGGKRVGPDLINIQSKRSADWTVSFIKSSQKMIKAGDPDAVAIYNEYSKILMPDQPLDEAQALAVLDYIAQKSKALLSGDVAAAPPEPVPDLLAGTTPANVRNGLLLFTGKVHLANRGPSCGACHKVKDDRAFTSGTLAKELTLSFETLGSAGVSAIIKTPPFPVMKAAYEKFPITDAEVIDLTAYLKSVSEERIYQHPREYSGVFGIAWFFFFVSTLTGIQVLYFRRKRKAVNHEIFSRQHQTIH